MKKLKILLNKVLGDKLFVKLIDFKTNMYEITNKKKLFVSRKAFYSSFINNNDLCFDVGANVGNRIEVLQSINAKVVAVEPQKDCIKTLKKKFGDSIQIVPKGLGAEKGYLDMFIATNSTISSFSKKWIDVVKQDRFSEYKWDKTEKIEITTLNELISIYGIPHFIKIDVEGFEFEVLKGLSTPIKYISIEYNVPDNLENATNCLKQISSFTPKATCNYSVGEGMTWALESWMTIEKMIDFIKTDTFCSTSFGDIYIKSN